MLTTDQINDLHRLYWSERWPIRKIERHLRMGWHTIKKYLDAPAQGPAQRQRESQLDPFKATIAEWLEKDPTATAAVIEQRLRPLGYHGGHSVLRAHIHAVRPQLKPSRAFLRMEPPPGERFEVDWGHFGVLDYATDKRKLYAFALVEAHSRMLYLEFTHSQSFETFVRCHVHAFTALGGVAREIAYDNLATAVAEHDGRLVRFLPRFLAFAREYGFYPKACNVAAGWEKGKVERAIGYARQNFWPLREFTDLHDVNRQARQWLSEIANQRQHRETRERPIDRFKAAALRPLPVIPYDHRDTVEALVHKDIRLQFDGNRYCVPHRLVGRRLTLQADSSSVTIYDRTHQIVSCPRCWRRGQTRGPDPGSRSIRSRTGRPPSRSQTVAGAATSLGGSGWPSFPSHAGSLPARHRRYRSRTLAATGRTAGTRPPVRTRTGGRCDREGFRGPRIRRRLHYQHPAPAAISAPDTTSPSPAQPAAQRAGHRSVVPAGIRRFHP
jgi:transposase